MRDAQRRVHEGQSRTRVDALGRTSSEASVRLHRQAAAGSAPSRPQRPGAGTNGRAAAAAELQPRYVGVGWRWLALVWRQTALLTGECRVRPGSFGAEAGAGLPNVKAKPFAARGLQHQHSLL